MFRNAPELVVKCLGAVYVFNEVVAGYEFECLVFEGQLVATAEHKRFAVGDELVHASVRHRLNVKVTEHVCLRERFVTASDV
jgi:hypothetical protein